MVEAGILYSAVFKDSTTLAFDPSGLLSRKNALAESAGSDELSGIIHVAVDRDMTLYYDMITGQLLITSE